ncbi:MAG TPA: choice-of-anchor J domain-containing protein [Flavobacterium sp.]|nr:choice-of-anchor J domain-containing protein [Flavobacterium sp.]
MNTSKFKSLLFFASVVALFTGCTKDDDFVVQDFTPISFAEDFSAGAIDNTILDTPNWENINEIGSAKWTEQIYSGNAYAEFSGYQSGDAINVGWLVSPAINMDLHEGEKLQFLSSQSYVTSGANSLEVLISTDYAGDVATATWTNIDANLPLTTSTYFEFLPSGEIDLSGYTGTVYLAFKVKGSGTNAALDGGYQIDNIRITYKKEEN